MNKEKNIPLTERIQKLGGPDGSLHVVSLEVLSRRIPLFFQGIAALTRMRCHRENLSCWLRWEAMEKEYYSKRVGHGQPCKEKNLLYWLCWGGIDLTKADDEEFFANLLLEPMYWLEECAKTQKGTL